VKWIFLCLILVNVALYLWATGHEETAVTSAPPAAAPVAPRSMELVAEQDGSAAASDQSGCVRIGPFSSEATYSDAIRKLSALEIPFSRKAVSTRELKTYRVYIGPYPSQDQLQSARTDLERRGMDHYLLEDADGRVLSLGLFSQPGPAAQFVADLAADGFAAKARAEIRTLGPLRWVEVRSADRESVTAQLRQTEWDDAMVSVREIPCL
jgi:hypothetical protein